MGARCAFSSEASRKLPQRLIELKSLQGGAGAAAGAFCKLERGGAKRDINSGTFPYLPAIFGVHVPCAVWLWQRWLPSIYLL